MKPQNKSFHLFLIIAAIIFFGKRATSQTEITQYKIYGKVADSVTKKPMDNITVKLLADANISLKTNLTKADGGFIFSGLYPQKYSIKITAVGYKEKTISIDLQTAAKIAQTWASSISIIR